MDWSVRARAYPLYRRGSELALAASDRVAGCAKTRVWRAVSMEGENRVVIGSGKESWRRAGGRSVTTFVGLLRGINVSGQKALRMDALKAPGEPLAR